MKGLAIPPPADAILERLGPPLLRTWDRDDVRIGGGTALAARWRHRRSTDIDLWVAPDLFRRAGEDFRTLAIEAGAGNVRSARGWLNGIFPEGEFVSRDFYDLCTASERDGASLERTLTALYSDERREIAREISGFGPSANRRGRPLTEVHRPEWLPDLAGLTARVVEHGAERTRTA